MMKIAILSRSPHAYSTRRLRQAAEDRGHRPKVLDTLRFSIDVLPGDPQLYYRAKRLSTYDAVLPRIGASITFFGTAVVRQFEQMDVFCANSSTGIANSRDKLRSLQILSRHDIGIPQTTFVRDRRDILPAIERVGGAPVIIKLLEGTQGIGVILADTVKVAEAIIETLQSTKRERARPAFRGGEPGPGRAGLRRRRPRRGGDAPSRRRRRVPQQRPPRRHDRSRGTPRSSTRKRPFARRRSWASGSRASTCSRARRAPWSWR